MTSFHEVSWPLYLSSGVEWSISRDVVIQERPSGSEVRIDRWSQFRRVYDLGNGDIERADLVTARKFYTQRRGSKYGFRLLDPECFTTASDGVSAHTSLDHVIGTGDGATVDFQLVTRDTDITGSEIRNIEKPISGTVLVAVAGTLKTEGTHYTVNHATGIVTFDSGSTPTLGQSITAGCEYEVAVRFGTQQAGAFSWVHGGGEIRRPSIPAIELFGSAVIRDDMYRGGGSLLALTADTWWDPRIHGASVRIQPTAANVLYLPLASMLTPGPQATLWNDDSLASFSVTVKSGGSTIGTLTAGSIKDARVFKTSSSQVWKLY